MTVLASALARPAATLPTTIEASIRRVVCEHLSVDPSRYGEGSNLVSDLGADSLDLLELLLALEQEFGIDLDVDAFVAVRTLGQIAPLVRERIAAQDAGASPALPFDAVDIEAWANMTGLGALMLVGHEPSGRTCAASYAAGAGVKLYRGDLARELWSAIADVFRRFEAAHAASSELQPTPPEA